MAAGQGVPLIRQVQAAHGKRAIGCQAERGDKPACSRGGLANSCLLESAMSRADWSALPARPSRSMRSTDTSVIPPAWPRPIPRRTHQPAPDRVQFLSALRFGVDVEPEFRS
jgi:hypothetical protein